MCVARCYAQINSVHLKNMENRQILLESAVQKGSWWRAVGYNISKTPIYVLICSLISIVFTFTVFLLYRRVVTEVLAVNQDSVLRSGFTYGAICFGTFMSVMYKMVFSKIVIPEADEIIVLENPFALNYPVVIDEVEIPEIEDGDPTRILKLLPGQGVTLNGGYMPVEVAVVPPWTTIMARFNIGPRTLTVTDKFPLKPEKLPGSKGKPVQRTVDISLQIRYQVIREFAGNTAARFFGAGCKGYDTLEEQLIAYIVKYMRQWLIDKLPSEILPSKSSGGQNNSCIQEYFKMIFGDKLSLHPQQVDFGISVNGFAVLLVQLTTAKDDEDLARKILEATQAAQVQVDQRKKLIDTYNAAGLSHEEIAAALIAEARGGGSTIVADGGVAPGAQKRGGKGNRNKQKGTP